jgi:flagellar P-ring protein precursor FlgI
MTSLLPFALVVLASVATAGPAPVAAASAAASPTSRIKDLAEVRGVRDNALFGYGLVVGLAGTGDTERVLFTSQSMSGMLGRLGVRVDPADVRSRNVAAVMVTATLPTFSRPGSRLDVTVSSLGDARSLSGGTLVVTPLLGADGKVYATAQGAVQTGGVVVEAAGSRVQRNSAATGRVPGGASVEASVKPDLDAGPVVLLLRQPDFSTAKNIAVAINGVLGEGRAKATDPAAVEIDRKDETALDVVAKIESVEVAIATRARIVISERTGTIVAGDSVRIRPATIAHGSLQVAVQSSPVVSQPPPLSGGTTTSTNQAQIQVSEGTGPVRAVPGATTVSELVDALNALGASPRDLIDILQALKAAGAVDAEIVVL